LRPMPGVMNQPGVMPPGGNVMQQGPGLPEGAQPTHVVGSQGRRGILPSAPGRAPVGQVNSKGQVTPVKDADGKFPCPHCTKTYLHAKHLKRHLLRREFIHLSSLPTALWRHPIPTFSVYRDAY
jgi:pyrrolidone-carboxylate peptidase